MGHVALGTTAEQAGHPARQPGSGEGPHEARRPHAGGCGRGTASGRLRFLAPSALALALLGCGGGPAQPGTALPVEALRCVFVSQILFVQGKDSPNLQRRRAEAARHLIEQGTPFAEVAKSQSQDPVTRMAGGFLGAWQPGRDNNEIMDGVMQVLEPGRLAGPVWSPRGWHVLLRHPYEEGRRMEREQFFTVWGLTVGWRELPDGPDRSQEEAEALARKVMADLEAGTLQLTEARTKYDSWKNTRNDGYVGVINRNPGTQPLFDLLAKTPEGRWAGPLRAEQGYVIAKRTPILRCAARHVLVQHLGALGSDLSMTRAVPEAERLANEALALALKDLRQWESIVQRYSDEHLTRMDLGSLGCVGPQEMPPPVEDALLATTPGTIHPKVVRSPRGFHVLWRLD